MEIKILNIIKIKCCEPIKLNQCIYESIDLCKKLNCKSELNVNGKILYINKLSKIEEFKKFFNSIVYE